MKRIRVIPILLLINEGLYKTVQFKNPNYIGDPINAVKIFNEKEADELIILDITATKDNKRINLKKIAEIAGEAFMPMGYGGGIKTFDDAKMVFDSGYEKVVINSAAHLNPNLISEVASVYGSQSVVVSIDAKLNWLGKYNVYYNCGSKKLDKSPEKAALDAQNAGAGEIFINAIHKDGTWSGFDIDLVKRVSLNVGIPVVACGGAGSEADLRSAILEGNASAVAAGSMFVYQKKGMGVLISFPSKELIV
jgi:imidazole glycerol-phosphate synthase subunit HisF